MLPLFYCRGLVPLPSKPKTSRLCGHLRKVEKKQQRLEGLNWSLGRQGLAGIVLTHMFTELCILFLSFCLFSFIFVPFVFPLRR